MHLPVFLIIGKPMITKQVTGNSFPTQPKLFKNLLLLKLTKSRLQITPLFFFKKSMKVIMEFSLQMFISTELD